MTAPQLKLNQAQPLSVDHLTFDIKNPRFAIDRYRVGGEPREIDVIRELHDNADLAELVQSIAANTYIDIEPLVVGRENDLYTVFEGNRRLAAIKILRNRQIADEIGAKLPDISASVAQTLEQVTVYPVKNRDAARAFIGFKHVNGPHTWDSFAKARFAAEWYKNEQSEGVTIRDIARNLGDRHDTVHRLVQGIYVLDQAASEGIFRIEDRYPRRQFAFSHLYTALTRPEYRKYLGLTPDWRAVDPVPDPVPTENLDKLRNVLMWLYGSKSEQIQPAIRSQNPDLKNLEKVLSKPVARKTMEETGSLKSALQDVDTGLKRLEQALISAYRSAKQAEGNVSSFDGSDHALVEVAANLNSSASYIHDAMQEKMASENSSSKNHTKRTDHQ